MKITPKRCSRLILVQLSKAAVTPILSLDTTCKIDFVNSFAEFGSILSLITHCPGSFNADAIKLKTSYISLFSINVKGRPFETIINNTKFSKCWLFCINNGCDT